MTPQQIWLSQSAEAPRISLEYVRHTANNLDRRTRRHNALNYGVIGASFAVCLWAAWQHFSSAKPIMGAGVICIGLWLVYCLFLGRRLGAAQTTPAEAGVLDTLRFHRRQLERQRDARRIGWRRGFPPVVPGFALMFVSLFSEFDSMRWDSIGIVAAGFLLAFGWGTWSTERQARGFQREIDALDSLAGPK